MLPRTCVCDCVAVCTPPPDNATLCSGARDTSVRVWDIASSKQTFQAQRPRNLVGCRRPKAGFERVCVRGGRGTMLGLHSRIGGRLWVLVWACHVRRPGYVHEVHPW